MYVNTATAGDIAVTAAEGGIGYWSQIDTYDWSRWQNEDGSPKRIDRNFIFYTLHRLNDDETGYQRRTHAVTPEVIQRGVNKYLSAGYVFDDRDLSMMDADEADAVIQFGIFGRMVFG